MAQLKDTIIFGDLEVLGELKLKTPLEPKITDITNNLSVHGVLRAIGGIEIGTDILLTNERFLLNVPLSAKSISSEENIKVGTATVFTNENLILEFDETTNTLFISTAIV